MKTRFIKEVPKENLGAVIRALFTEMLGHSSFHFEWDGAKSRFVAISPDDAWDTLPNSEIAEIIVRDKVSISSCFNSIFDRTVAKTSDATAMDLALILQDVYENLKETGDTPRARWILERFMEVID